MDCIFKTNGYVPTNHACTRCVSLESLLLTTKGSAREASQTAKAILQAFTVLKLEDSYRDEKALHKRVFAKAASGICQITLPKNVRAKVKYTNSLTQKLEGQNVDADTYVSQLSNAGASIFESAGTPNMPKPYLRQLGASITGTLLLHDMTQDLAADKTNNKYNPLKTSKPSATTTAHSQTFKKLADPILKNATVNANGFIDLSRFCGLFCRSTNPSLKGQAANGKTTRISLLDWLCGRFCPI
jgi:hypothetical protein